MTEIDKFDLKLISELEKDSRQTLSQIAKRMNSSQQVISYRIKSLEKRKVIGEYYTALNITTLGYTSYRTMVRLSSLNDEVRKEIINYLMEQKSVLWFVEVGGRWDLLVNFLAKNIIQFNSILQELKNKFPKQIQNYDILTTVEVDYFGRNYFTNQKRSNSPQPHFGESTKETKLDETDLKIMYYLSENARINAVEIADKLGISPNTVILRMKDLKKLNIIQGFKPLVHLENIGFSGYKALVKFQNISAQIEKEIKDYLFQDTRIVGIVKLVGAWDFEIEFEVSSQHETLDMTRKFRDEFKEVIKELEIVPLFHEYRYNFFPGDLLKK